MENIAFLSRHEFNPTYGGIERVTDLLAKELLRRGIRFIISCWLKM